jgi:hypothetical protein
MISNTLSNCAKAESKVREGIRANKDSHVIRIDLFAAQRPAAVSVDHPKSKVS